MLEERDRERIREEMLLREDIRNELAKPIVGQRGILPILNSPFAITVIAGILLSLLSQTFICSNADKERLLTQEKANREKMTSIITLSANDISTFLSLEGSWIFEKIWLRNNKGAEDMRLGRSREEVYKSYREHWNLMMQARKPDAVFSEIKSFFCTAEVAHLTKKMAKILETIGELKTEESVDQTVRDGNRTFESLIGAMGAELQHVNNRERVCPTR
jgi:hypothetical protein